MSKSNDTRLDRGNAGTNSDASSIETEEGLSPPEGRRRRHGRPPGVEKEWYNKVEAARYLGVAEITVTRYLGKGILHAQRLPTPGGGPRSSGHDYGRLRIHRSELDRYLESIDRNPTGPTAQGGVAPGLNADKSAIPSSGINREVTSIVTRGVTNEVASEVMTREEAALRLGVSWRTIKRYIESGKLRLAGYFRCPDSYTRAHVYRSDVEKLLQR